ncbi:MAG: RluA family pseudouridine synthase [Clostridiales bacterium]|jgi:23S rRNA pseudouridine955/2504/2580 synthase|nr:RluA family pseudouridine synthase [Clostridiales bacterium]
MRTLDIPLTESGGRLDKYLQKYLNGAPKNFIYKMLRLKRIKLNGTRADGNEILQSGDNIIMYFSDETIENFSVQLSGPSSGPSSAPKKVVKSAKPLDIIFEDANLLIVNKPVGLLVHSDTADNRDTLIDRIKYHLLFNDEKINDSKNWDAKEGRNRTFSPSVSNRLDRNTGGVVICGKNPAAVRSLNKMIADDDVKKQYLAVVCGIVRKPIVLEGEIFKDQKNNISRVINHPAPRASLQGGELNNYDANGMIGSRSIKTEMIPERFGNDITLVRVNLYGGRSHQIRAHLQSAGYPIVGDPKYGNPQLNRRLRLKYQLLFAERVIFMAQGELLSQYYGRKWIAPPPEHFASFIRTHFGGGCIE